MAAGRVGMLVYETGNIALEAAQVLRTTRKDGKSVVVVE